MDKKISYRTKGTCSSVINLTIADDDTIKNVEFIGGCNGNLKAISLLVCGMKAQDAAAKLSGITCGFKNTSCADQLSLAIKKTIGNSGQNNI